MSIKKTMGPPKELDNTFLSSFDISCCPNTETRHIFFYIAISKNQSYHAISSSIFLFSLFHFLNYESMITHLQETWKVQNKVTYSPTIYCNYF